MRQSSPLHEGYIYLELLSVFLFQVFGSDSESEHVWNTVHDVHACVCVWNWNGMQRKSLYSMYNLDHWFNFKIQEEPVVF